jgi:cell division protein FtsL
VNKVVVIKKAKNMKNNYTKSNYINGNTVLAPQYDPSIDEEYLKLKKKRKERLKNKNKKAVKTKLTIIRNIVLVFIVGVTLIGRYSSIYNMQKQVNNTQDEITNLNLQNDNLKVELVKQSDITKIEDTAVKKLNMVQPDKNVATYIDLSKDNFNNDTKITADKNNNIIGELMKALF